MCSSYSRQVHVFACSTSQSPVTIADEIDSSPTHYIFSYGTGSSIPISTNSTPQCTSSSCQHTFRATSHHVQQYTVSVATRNVVGVGNSSTPVTVGMKQNTLGCTSVNTLTTDDAFWHHQTLATSYHSWCNPF